LPPRATHEGVQRYAVARQLALLRHIHSQLLLMLYCRARHTRVMLRYDAICHADTIHMPPRRRYHVTSYLHADKHSVLRLRFLPPPALLIHMFVVITHAVTPILLLMMLLAITALRPGVCYATVTMDCCRHAVDFASVATRR